MISTSVPQIPTATVLTRTDPSDSGGSSTWSRTALSALPGITRSAFMVMNGPDSIDTPRRNGRTRAGETTEETDSQTGERGNGDERGRLPASRLRRRWRGGNPETSRVRVVSRLV